MAVVVTTAVTVVTVVTAVTAGVVAEEVGKCMIQK